MKILHTVEFYHPSVGGMQEVVRQLSERLVKLGHNVTVATTRLPQRETRRINGVNIAEFDIQGNLVRGFSGDVDEYRSFLLNSDFDIVTNFAAQQWATDLALEILDRIEAKKVLVPTGFSGLYLPDYQEYFEKMKSWMKLYDMNVFLSNDYRDINFARNNGINNIILIPNGAGADEFLATRDNSIRRKLGIPNDNFLILLVGSHTGSKGHHEAIEIFRQARIKQATLLIIGNDFGSGCARSCYRAQRTFNLNPKRFFEHKQLLIKVLSREDTVSAYHEADLFLFPSQIECSPLVLFECMASHTPFLATDVGNVREIIDWSHSGMLLPTKIDKQGYSHPEIEDSARMLEEFYHDRWRRAVMAEAGFNVWRRRFTWEKLTRDYEILYSQLIG